MDTNNLILESQMIEVASYKNYKEAIFLISVLNEPDAYGRIIPEDAGEKYASTIIGFPIVAKLKKNIFGQPSDFDGHDVHEIKAKNGKKIRRFGTTPIGSVLSAWVEERELDDFDEPKKCILCKAKLWSSRFPEYFKVFDKLWEMGRISSSWELTATKVEEKDGFKIYKVFEFISNCLLGSSKVPAVKQAGVIEYAELENDYDLELAEALEKDIADLDIDDEEKEEVDLAEKTKNDTPVEDTASKDLSLLKTVNETEENKNTEIAEHESETTESSTESETKAETASLTDRDLYRRITDACVKAFGYWGYISYWFPEEKTVWFKAENAETSLDYKLFTYEVSDDVVTVSEPQDVKLTVSISDVNTVIAEKDSKIGALTAELQIKDDAVIKAGEKINTLNIAISELRPYKEAADKAEQERIEAEIAEAKKILKDNMLKNNLFTEEEVSKPEIAELIESRNETAIKNLIAERYIASFDNDESNVHSDTASYEKTINTSVASLEIDEIDETPSDFMKNLLKRK